MYVRVTTFPGLAPERIKATLEEFQAEHLPRYEQQSGYRGVFGAVDYPGGRAIVVTYWDSLEALQASDQLAADVRTAAVSQAGLDRSRPPIIDRYQVVLDRTPDSSRQ